MDFDSPELLQRLRIGDELAFAALVRAHQPTLITVARSIIGEALADEVVQESWLLAFKALPTFEARSKVKTWLFSIVSNHAKTRLRKEKRTQSLDAFEGGAAAVLESRFGPDQHWASPLGEWHINTPESLLEEAQLRRCIEHTLSLLPPVQRAVFTLRDLEQLPLAEICNSLEVSESNVRVLLHRARVKLFEVIEHYQETGEC